MIKEELLIKAGRVMQALNTLHNSSTCRFVPPFIFTDWPLAYHDEKTALLDMVLHDKELEQAFRGIDVTIDLHDFDTLEHD